MRLILIYKPDLGEPRVAAGPREPREDAPVGCLPTTFVIVGIAILVVTGVLNVAGVGFLLLIGGVMLGLAHWAERWRRH